MNNNTQLYYNILLYLLKNNKRTSEAVANLTQQTIDDSLIATIKKASEIIIGKFQKGNEDELFSIFDNLDKKDNFQNKVPQRVIGLQKEDVIVRINQTKASNFSLQEINDLLKNDTNAYLFIEIRRKNTILKFKLPLQSIL